MYICGETHILNKFVYFNKFLSHFLWETIAVFEEVRTPQIGLIDNSE